MENEEEAEGDLLKIAGVQTSDILKKRGEESNLGRGGHPERQKWQYNYQLHLVSKP